MRKALLFILLPIAATAQPKLVIKPGVSVDFGNISRTDSLKKQITIANEGTETLLISNVRPGCGCTATLLSDNRIPQGGSATLNVAFDPTHYKGKVTKSVTITSNDPVHSTINFTFSANVIVNVDVTPEYLVFANAKKRASSTQTLTVTNHSGVPLRITSAEVDKALKGLTVSMSRSSIPPDGSATVKATFVGETSGTITGVVMLHTSDKTQPAIEIRVYGFVQE